MNKVNKTDSDPALLALGEEDKQVPTKAVKCFEIYRGMKEGVTSPIVFTTIFSALRTVPRI